MYRGRDPKTRPQGHLGSVKMVNIRDQETSTNIMVIMVVMVVVVYNCRVTSVDEIRRY